MEDKCDEIFTMKLHFQNHLAGLLHSFATKKLHQKSSCNIHKDLTTQPLKTQKDELNMRSNVQISIQAA